MFASTVLNYMDRQAITLVKHEISQYFSIPDSTDFGWVLAAFSMTYALFQVPAGYLVDRWDLRWCYAAAVAWWSLAAIATSVVPSLGWLFACRALLGVGESFNWPLRLRVTARVLPPKDRSLGNGIFNSGAAVGAVLTPAVVVHLMPSLGWRGTFLAIGSLGFVWVTVWVALVRGPRSGMLARQKPAISGERPTTGGRPQLSPPAGAAFAGVAIAVVVACGLARWYGLAAVWVAIAVAMLGPLAVAGFLPRHALGGLGWATSLHEIARLKRFWILAVVSISINICWHFLVNWIPTYLRDDRGMNRSVSGYLTSATFLAADLGNLGGGCSHSRLPQWASLSSGATSGHIALHGLDPDRDRAGDAAKRRLGHRPAVPDGSRNRRVHGQLLLVHAGRLAQAHGSCCRVFGWFGKSHGGCLSAVRRCDS